MENKKDNINEQDIIETDNNTQLLKEKIKTLEESIALMEESLLRARADMENQIKRSKKEMESTRMYALSHFLMSLMPYIDSLEEGIKNTNIANILAPLKDNLLTLLLDFNVNTINPEPLSQFDFNKHEVVSTIKTQLQEQDGLIYQCIRSGYILNGRLLRPGRVILFKFNQEEKYE